jgi:hypothetical protein
MCIPCFRKKLFDDVRIQADTDSVCCNNIVCQSSCCIPLFRSARSSNEPSPSPTPQIERIEQNTHHHAKHKKRKKIEKIEHVARPILQKINKK